MVSTGLCHAGLWAACMRTHDEWLVLTSGGAGGQVRYWCGLEKGEVAHRTGWQVVGPKQSRLSWPGGCHASRGEHNERGV